MVLMRRVVRKVARKAMVGRYLDRNETRRGRFTREDVDRVLEGMWPKFERLLADAHLERWEARGNRQNVTLAALSLATFRALLEFGVERDYAIELFSDVGWVVYQRLLRLPRFVARLASRDPQKRMNRILRRLLRYPFSPPGYKRRWWLDRDRFCVDIYRCPPYEFIKENGEEGDAEFFYKTWCTYDDALAQAIVKGGYYERPHTLSRGDDVCDMRWYARRPTGT